MTSIRPDILDRIRERADRYDQTGDWPADDLRDLAGAGAMRWAVPNAFGGDEVDPIEIHKGYETVASASLATALILTQRDSAIGLIKGSEHWPQRESVLRELARDEYFTTVGIAQLTTSRQGAVPVLRAIRIENGYRIDGYIPWSSGPGRAKFIVAGAVLEDRQQILFALPADLKGVTVEPALELVALRSSWTTQIKCDHAIVEDRWLMRPPSDSALAGKNKGVALSQAFLALGLCSGSLNLIGRHTSDSAKQAHRRLQAQFDSIQSEIYDLSDPTRQSEASQAAPRIRGTVNDLAIRITHSAVAIYKGTALLAGHPAQRLAREAMFLLVWSCPSPVIDCTLDTLTR